VDGRLDPRAFTIHPARARFDEVGDLWGGLRTGKSADLQAVFDKYR
jgi:imidazolonepropionase-like amidohydrolase